MYCDLGINILRHCYVSKRIYIIINVDKYIHIFKLICYEIYDDIKLYAIKIKMLVKSLIYLLIRVVNLS